MDLFVEKIVERKKNIFDYMLIFSIFFFSLFLASLILLVIGIDVISAGLLIVLAYLAYYLISLRKVEYEYAITNGELDIDKIVAQRRRKRVFSAKCRDFDVFGKLDSEKYNDEVRETPQKIKAVTSMNSEDVYFFTANYKGSKVLVFFEPDERMLKSLKPYISKKMNSFS
ncbi:DUF6106 family protein [Herbivorax sp. ANBcel31]|uniref:DUF6106 family protein n=1 Tax=Herbivorax sp. ANBcel31 TaxID=3069754 RepID=UPI0027B18E1A|nr:DUF6106 family protein [Herbivorax sp. ANBcel31]MDQ2087700.1 DUF6106 family protein [Herbivorax sp. ANBcel31]